MVAWYNENDAYAAQWLRNLIAEGLIAPGEVDQRSIVDVRPDDLTGFTQCHFFAGIGGWSRALRLAGWDDDRAVWTGSYPCQPFSLAGKQKGFADDRHLWPVWRELIRKRRPADIFGEQVASAAEWLRLVRGDLEAMGYAVGAMPVEAASAGADHLRNRFWFVAHSSSAEWRAQPEGWDVYHGYDTGRKETASGHSIYSERGVGLADANDARSQGRQLLPERTGEWITGPDGMADADELGSSEEWQQRSGQQRRVGSYQETCTLGNGESIRGRSGLREDGAVEHWNGPASTSGTFEWVVGADGKARRVKPGIRLLAHGIPARVAKLRAFGNAIVPDCAAEFIGAFMETRYDRP